jgi:hypothetical protein
MKGGLKNITLYIIFYILKFGKNFNILSINSIRYDNLKPIGDGSYGFVASADDKISGML